MAYEIPGFTFSLAAGADLSAAVNQYKWVQVTTGKLAILSGDDDAPTVGVLQNHPASGAEAEIMSSGISKVRAADATALAVGALIGPDANGLSEVKSAVTDLVLGVMVDAAASATPGPIGSALIGFQGRFAAQS